MSDALRFQSLASQVAARFVDLPAEEIDGAIKEVLGEIGEYFEVDIPFYGFFAALNLYQFDVFKNSSAPDTSR